MYQQVYFEDIVILTHNIFQLQKYAFMNYRTLFSISG